MILNLPYLKNCRKIKSACMNVKQQDKASTMAWHNYQLLMAKKSYPFVLVCYENLIRNGEQVLKEIFCVWSMPVEKKVISHLLLHADWTIYGSQIIFRKNLLAGWETGLSVQQVSNILNLLKSFNRSSITMSWSRIMRKLKHLGSN